MIPIRLVKYRQTKHGTNRYEVSMFSGAYRTRIYGEQAKSIIRGVIANGWKVKMNALMEKEFRETVRVEGCDSGGDVPVLVENWEGGFAKWGIADAVKFERREP